MSAPELLATVKAVADMGGALVFSVYVAWEVRLTRSALERLVERVRVVELRP